MIISLSMTAMFLLCGFASIRFLLPGHRPLNRIWLGLALGLLEEMWLPALFSFLYSFTVTAHLAALGAAGILTAACFFLRDKRPLRKWDKKESELLWQMGCVVVPLAVLSGYLQYSHVMREDLSGNWNVGQSTYGDLPMHLSFITHIVGKKFPVEYPFYPGTRLSYPFLADSMSSTFYLFGTSLQASVTVPGTLMMTLCYMGVMILSREMTCGRKTVVLATALFFLNGGLGFLYDYDLAGGFGYSGKTKIAERTEAILSGYYKTPTNQPTPNNLRWSNVICDLMIPQRTLLGGWCMVFPCFYLLTTAFRLRRGDGENSDPDTYMASMYRDDRWRELILLGIWSGSLPLIHTHSFLALVLASLGLASYDFIHGDPEKEWNRGIIVFRYALYALVAAALSLPQLLKFTFAQVFQEESRSFLRFQFNWVNNPGGHGMIDLYFWFYIKNIGLPFIALLLALFDKDPKQRRIFSAAIPIILAGELICFQPNEYDNNKLLYLAWLLCCMIVANWIKKLWHRLKGARWRGALAFMTAIVLFLSAGLTIWRECLSDYRAFSKDSVEAGNFVKNNTEEDAVFLTGTQHLNPVLSIGGRTVVCGPDLWLYWHGFNTEDRKAEISGFYSDPLQYSSVIDKYGVDYIYVSSYERADYPVNTEILEEFYPVVFRNREATVYKVPEG